ncbi:MAG: hypothetical protein ABIZ04_17395 [Opitutus sp.]
MALLASRATGTVPPLLDGALEKVSADYDRWAYTQATLEKNEKGKVLKRAIVRFDPSKPYAEQYVPLEIDGHAPDAGDFKKYRKQGERRGERVAEAETEGTTPPRKTLGELMDLDEARLVSETGDVATFEVPLKKEGNNRLPPEKFQVLARVSKRTGAFESIVAQLRSPMRAEVIVKIKSGVGRLEFATVDPQFSPALASISGSGAGSIMFVPVGRSYELVRSDYVRVKPFGNKFQVKMGPLKSIDF